MFRTVTVYKGERISVDEGWMVVSSPDGQQHIPIEDIYSVVVDNYQASLTVPAITKLTANGAHILVCNEKHLPVTVILPQDIHYHPLTVMRNQLSLPEDIKNKLWDRIVEAKIQNQADVLRLCGGDKECCDRLFELSCEVYDGDAGNREGIAAKMFFRNMYGIEFVRSYDSAINAALNYGYTVIRSAVAKTLAAYGFNCVLGLHHINESNAFNLADDVMEPLRPLVDMWVSDNCDELVGELTKNNKNGLASLVNGIVLWDGKKMRARNAIDKYVSSLSAAVTKLSPKLLKIPGIIRVDEYGDTDD